MEPRCLDLCSMVGSVMHSSFGSTSVPQAIWRKKRSTAACLGSHLGWAVIEVSWVGIEVRSELHVAK